MATTKDKADGATKRTRVRRPAGESIEVKLGAGILTVTLVGSPLTMDAMDLQLVQEIKRLIDEYRDGVDDPGTTSATTGAARRDLAENRDLVTEQ